MALTCPKCAAVIPVSDINVATDVAMCRGCGTMHKAADLVHDEVLDQVQAESADVLRGPQPPGVTWSDDGQTLRITAKIGSRMLAGVFALFAGFWTIGALVFTGDIVSDALGGPADPLPEGASEFEAARHEMMNAAPDFGDWIMAVVLTGIPLLFWALVSTCFFARARITVRPDVGRVVKGSFPFYIRRQFDPARVTAVNEVVDTSTRVNGQHPTKIVIACGDEQIGFGGFMPPERRKWVAAILRANLLRRR